jgi:hypothetical protein
MFSAMFQCPRPCCNVLVHVAMSSSCYHVLVHDSMTSSIFLCPRRCFDVFVHVSMSSSMFPCPCTSGKRKNIEHLFKSMI